MSDTLIVKGLRPADGRYELDLIKLVSIGDPSSLDTREQHLTKIISGVRPADLQEAVRGLDAAVFVALTFIILARHGKTVPEERIWDSRIFFAGGIEESELPDYSKVPSYVLYLIQEREEEQTEDADGEDDARPPDASPEPLSRSSGESLKPTSAL